MFVAFLFRNATILRVTSVQFCVLMGHLVALMIAMPLLHQ